MNKQSLLCFVKDVRMSVKKHSPKLLIGIGIAGMLSTTVLAVKATPKALKLIEEKKQEKGADTLTAVEVIEASWKCYIPAMVTGVMATACLIGANSMNLKRNAALATAYALSETARREYHDKVLEMIGEKKDRMIQDSIAKDKIEKNPVTNNEVHITNKGDTLCYDVFSGRYFKSDIEKMRKAENELNRQILSDGYATLNDFYYIIGLDTIKIGDTVGWNSDKGLVTLNFSSQLASDGTPCVVLGFDLVPTYGF